MTIIAGHSTHDLDGWGRLYVDNNGWLTGYALAVGYRESVDFGFGRVCLALLNGRYVVASSATAESEAFDNLDDAHARFAALVESVAKAVST